jgi:hypothetical protein
VVLAFAQAEALGARQRLLPQAEWLYVPDGLASLDAARALSARLWPLMDDQTALVALGGGTVMDLAKWLRHRPALGFEALCEALREGRPAPGRKALLVLLPSTAGTGSEVSRSATLWDLQAGSKLSLDPAWADAALVDPDWTHSVPLDVTAGQRSGRAGACAGGPVEPPGAAPERCPGAGCGAHPARRAAAPVARSGSSRPARGHLSGGAAGRHGDGADAQRHCPCAVRNPDPATAPAAWPRLCPLVAARLAGRAGHAARRSTLRLARASTARRKQARRSAPGWIGWASILCLHRAGVHDAEAAWQPALAQ